MKKLTRKLFISVLVAVFAFVALGTSTYAWITLSTAAQIQTFEAKVEAGDAGIELSENYGTVFTALAGDAEQATKAIEQSIWKTDLTLSDTLKNSFVALDDVTTDDGVVFVDYKPAIVDGKNVMVKDEAGSANGKYIEFSVWVKRSNTTSTTATNIKVNTAKVVFTKGTTVDGTFTYNNAGTPTPAENLFATNALRMSITGNLGNTVIYEQNTTTDDNTAGSVANGYAHEYAKSQDISIEYVKPAYEAQAIQATTGADSATIVTIDGSEVAEIKIRLWIEGWDNECHAQILTQSFSVALGFEIA